MQHYHDSDRPSAPDYTVPALIMLGVNLFLVLAVLWVAYGFAVPLLLGGALLIAFDYWAERRRR
ncbi:hypothetical protein [Chachezhania sediminis]|uniref:hypothetical protein n=1 Tax=Chachezhania sediminis TaxID=2599291 RepID=UPI00131E61FA|nr:hypothetical protein [Chachezhania sediminis]